MENSKVLVLIGITLIIWCALYRYRTTTAKWVFIAASLSTCLAFVLGLSGFLGLGHGYEVPRVLFLGICLDFYYFLRRVLLPKIGFHFDWGSVSQALVKPHLVPP